jgi:prepilin-type N-terminal cleavage/methylation domain-containing protein
MRAIKLLSQKGMTLPEILIAAALMGGVALITAKLMGDQSNNQAYLKDKAEVSSTITKIESFLNNPEQCTWMLKDKSVTAAGTSVGAGGLDFTTPAGDTINVIREAKYQSFDILPGGIRLQNSVYGANVSDVVIDFTMKGKLFTYGPSGTKKVITKRIQVVTDLDAAWKIRACGPVLGDAEAVGQEKMCASLGNAAQWNGTKCVLNNVKCPYGTVATKMTSLGGIICTAIKDQVNLGEIFDLNGVNCVGKPSVQIITVGNKLKVSCF